MTLKSANRLQPASLNPRSNNSVHSSRQFHLKAGLIFWACQLGLTVRQGITSNAFCVSVLENTMAERRQPFTFY